MTKRRLHISDHAVLRYLERVGGFEIERLRKSMAERLNAAAQAGANAVVIDGYAYVIRRDQHGPVVTTVLLADLPQGHHRESVEE